MAIEDQVGTYPVPVGCPRHFVINGERRTVLLATEEATVVAAASKGARLAIEYGGIRTVSLGPPRMVVQIQYSQLADPPAALAALRKAYDTDLNDRVTDVLKEKFPRGYPVRMLPPRFVPCVRPRADGTTKHDTFVVVELQVNTLEAMGANLVTRIGTIVAHEVLLNVIHALPTSVICSNMDAGRQVKATATFKVPSGNFIRERLLDVDALAQFDVARAVTHNKGIMNGIAALAQATGQDCQAIEACVHKQADQGFGYRPLTRYLPFGDECVRAELQLWLPVGTVGGGTASPAARANLRLMGISDADDLARVMVSVGLAQNVAAMLCLAGEGIVEAHRRVAARATARK